MPHKVLLFIPAYNCSAQLPRVLQQVRAQHQCGLFHQCLVLDNVSTDTTVASARASLEADPIPNTILATNFENRGLGGSLKTAFEYAIREGFTHVLVLHGDDQASLQDILPALADKALMNQSDIVIGARFHPQSVCEGYSIVRMLGNRVLNALCSLVLRRRIYDLIAGLNIFSVDYLRSRFYTDYPNNLTFDFHCLLHACQSGGRIHFVPISWREEDQVSNAKAVRQGLTILSLLLRAALANGKNPVTARAVTTGGTSRSHGEIGPQKDGSEPLFQVEYRSSIDMPANTISV